MLEPDKPVWLPVFKYESYDRVSKGSVPRSFTMHGEPAESCPKSIITSESAELVFKYFRAKAQGKHLGKLLATNEAWIEDAEDVLRQAMDDIKEQMQKARLQHA